MTKLEVGRTYYGHGNQRVHVLAIDEKNSQATIQWPVSLKTETWSLDRLAEHAAASPLRTYYVDGPQGHERRTKLEVLGSGRVRFKDERTGQRGEVSGRKWASWLKGGRP